MKPRVFFGNYEYKISKKASWLKIYYQDVDIGVFTEINDARSCNEPGKYSILEEARNVTRYENEYFEFLLEYPGLAGFNRWKQSIYPLDTINENVGEFVNVSCTWTQNSWKGLGSSTHGCSLLDGSIGSYNWFYAIGMKDNCEDTIFAHYFPGPSDSRQKVYLWMRVPNIRGELLCSYKSNIYHRISLLSSALTMLYLS